MKKVLLTCFLFTSTYFLFAQSYTINTIVGGGVGDGGPATAEGIRPYDIAVDNSGNMYMADYSNNRIRKISSSGVISTIAGNGYNVTVFSGGFSGDGGPGTAAELFEPTGIAVDDLGNVYFTDNVNERVRKINTAGIITTIVGNGNRGYAGDNGAATEAELDNPSSITLGDSGSIYITDENNSCVRKINSLGIITTIAGNGTSGYLGDYGAATAAELKYPFGVAIDGKGNVYIADEGNDVVREVNTAGIITTLAGNGTAGYTGNNGAAYNAELHDPYGVAVDDSNNVYIADQYNNCIRRVSTTGIITTIAGNGYISPVGGGAYTGDGGPATAAELYNPYSITFDGLGNMYIADQVNFRIRKVSTDSIITTVAGNGVSRFAGDNSPATNGELFAPVSTVIDENGNLYIADQSNQCIRKVSTNNVITTIAGNSTAGYGGDYGPATAAELYSPCGVAVDDTGNVYIADQLNNRIRKVGTNGIIVTMVGGAGAGFAGDNGPATAAELRTPAEVLFDGAGNMYISDFNNDRIRKVNTNGIITTFAGNGTAGFAGDSGAATAAELNGPVGITFDAFGNFYIADKYNDRVREINTNGIITTLAGTGFGAPGKGGYSGDGGDATAAELYYPMGVAVDGAGNIYIADIGNQRIRMVDGSGIITTIAGNGLGGFMGDGGPASAAELYTPSGVMVDGVGDIYITDYQNERIRELVATSPTQVNKIFANSNGVTIYPVPGNGNFTVALKGSGYQLLTIYDETGKQMLSKVLNKKNTNSTIALDMSMYASGIYFAKIVADKGIVNKKIVIQK